MAPKQKKVLQEVRNLKPVPCDECKDLNGKRIGRYVYVDCDQELLDSFFKSWIDTYNNDNAFFATLDLETQGLDFTEDEILLVSICTDGSNALVFDPNNFNLDWFIQFLNTVPLSNHNIKFDFKMLIYKYKVRPILYFDTLTASQMAFAGIFKLFGLDSLVDKLLPYFKISKQTRNTFIGKEVGTPFTREQIEYAARDSILTHLLVRPIIRKLVKDGQYQLWDRVDRNVLKLLVYSEIAGVKIDYDKLRDAYETLKKELKELETALNDHVSLIPKEELPKTMRNKPFNPMSPKMIPAYLKTYGIEVPNASKEVLNDLKAKHDNDFLVKLIDYRALHAKVNKQMKKWLEESYNPLTQSVHPNNKVCGAVTGRLCLDFYSKVLTENGLVNIGNIEPGTKVLTHMGRFKEVEARIYKGKEEMFEVELENGNKIICTKEHLMLGQDGWISLGNGANTGSPLYCYAANYNKT